MADESKVPVQRQGGRLPSSYSDPFQAFRTGMDRLFDDFLTGWPTFPSLGRTLAAPEVITPALDIKETEKELVVKADLPGIDDKDVQLTIRDGILTLRGEKKSERKDERENYHLVERSYGSFQRSIRLPESVDEDKAQARFDKGVLTVTLPKRPEAVKQQKKIEIKSS
jgi:HSP20 family protein